MSAIKSQPGRRTRRIAPETCSLCGEVKLLAFLTPERRPHYLKQITVFKTYLSQSGNEDDDVVTCAHCLLDVQQVWDLTQQLDAIKQEIASIVEKVRTNRSQDGNTVSKEAQTKLEPMQMEDSEDWQEAQTSQESKLDFDPVVVEVKKEIPWNEVEFEFTPINHELEETDSIQVKEEFGQESIDHGEDNYSKFNYDPDPDYLPGKKRKRRVSKDPLASSEDEEDSSLETTVKTVDSVFLKSVSLFEDRQTVLQTIRHVCLMCGVKFHGEPDYKRHIKKHIDKNMNVECSICQKRICVRSGFKNLVPNIRNHIRRMHPLLQTNSPDPWVASWARSRVKYL